MKHAKLLVVGALAAGAWCAAPQAQTILYGVDLSAGTTPSESDSSAYPKHPANIGYAVSGYWDNGVWWERTDPVAVDRKGRWNYVYPETARLARPPATIIYPAPTVVYPAPEYRDHTYELRIE